MALVKTLLRKRVSLSFQPDEYDVLGRIAKAQGHNSKARVLEDLFHELRPVLERMVAVTEAAQRAQEITRAGLRESVERTQAVADSHAAAALKQFDWLLNQAQGNAPVADPKTSAAGRGHRGGGTQGKRKTSKRVAARRVKAVGKRKRGRK